jgi:sialate O-acetylesterase
MTGITAHKVILALLLCATSAGAAEFKVANVFQDHMVLQRDKPIKIWGWTDVGGRVSVAFAGQTKNVEAGKDGKWMVTLDPIPASSAGRTMTVASSAGRQTVEIKDVLVGEVWVCSGQSNMSYNMSRFRNCAKEVPRMKYPLIREFKTFRLSMPTPQPDALGAWAVCSPDTAARFSATALYYAVELHQALNVPIGLLNSSVGGTKVEQWTDTRTLHADLDEQSRAEKQAAAATAADASAQTLATYTMEVKEFLAKVGVNPSVIIGDTEDAFIKPDLTDAAWTPIELPVRCGSGVTWFAREVALPKEMIGKELILNLGTVNKEEITFWNGVRVGSQLFYSEGSVHTIPAKLVEGNNTLSVRCTGYRGGGMSAGQSLSVAGGQPFSIAGEGWKQQTYATEPNLPRGVRGTLYNGMIHPLIPYTIRGVIWYQGEQNTGNAIAYRKQFPDMIKGWRKNWGQGDFPFYFCQLANYHPKQNAVSINHGWPLLREAQARALSLPNTGMACLIDIGKLGTYERDIHPANNRDQGRRLALIARNKIYGEDIVSSGPMFDSMTVEGGKITVKFKSVGSGLMRAGITGWYDHRIIPLPTHPRGLAIHGFTIADADGDFRMAHARITGKDTVEVWHGKVPEPVHIRFAWHRNPLHNLYNREKLPAVPFHTDQIDLLKKPQ